MRRRATQTDSEHHVWLERRGERGDATRGARGTGAALRGKQCRGLQAAKGPATTR